jgi:hypothetical protein
MIGSTLTDTFHRLKKEFECLVKESEFKTGIYNHPILKSELNIGRFYWTSYQYLLKDLSMRSHDTIGWYKLQN